MPAGWPDSYMKKCAGGWPHEEEEERKKYQPAGVNAQ